MVAHDYLADKVAQIEAVIEDLECVAETPGDFEALMRLTELRDGLRVALEPLEASLARPLTRGVWFTRARRQPVRAPRPTNSHKRLTGASWRSRGSGG